MFAILLVLLAQSPCSAQESTVVCSCKQGSASACEALRQTDAALADKLESAAHVTAAVTAVTAVAQAEGEREAAETARAESAPASPEPPDCKGQLHHIISRLIARALRNHRTLRGLYEIRDPRFVSRAVDEKAHCGYQDWHRQVDEEVTQWLTTHERATAEEFEAFLRQIYNRSEMRARFPYGF